MVGYLPAYWHQTCDLCPGSETWWRPLKHIRLTSGRYTSHWDAFLLYFLCYLFWFMFIFRQIHEMLLKRDDKSALFSFFKKKFGGCMSFLWGQWYPCFGLLVMSSLGFKARAHTLACALRRQRATDPSSVLDISGMLLEFFSLNVKCFVFKFLW